MTQQINTIAIVGGGSAGWLTAGMIAAKHKSEGKGGVSVILLESPNVKTIGVGEGTWPTMRSTLQKIGVSETEFIRQCDVSFKQGTKFQGWRTGNANDFFYQPFTPPQGYFDRSMVPGWLKHSSECSFSNFVCHQEQISEAHQAPKQITTPEYSDIVNYAYHLDAGKFGHFLRKHCVETLGVTHRLGDVIAVNKHENGNIKSLVCEKAGELHADLFVDCTGFKSLLLGEHFNVPFLSKQDVLFIDSALAVQVPYQNESEEIMSPTLSTAQPAGWLWDIGLQSRRGVGHVYCSHYMSEDEAYSQLMSYIGEKHGNPESLSVRKIAINAGHRQTFWVKNCVAIGLSAGFLEPLEASALALVEYSAKLLSERLPRNPLCMEYEANNFNRQMTYHWQRIIDFLKLHYVLSKRNEPFWQANRDSKTIPDSLRQALEMWKYRVPEHNEFSHAEEVFPAAGYQYVLYGMGFKTHLPDYAYSGGYMNAVNESVRANRQLLQHCRNNLPGNRELLNKIKQFGLQKY